MYILKHNFLLQAPRGLVFVFTMFRKTRWFPERAMRVEIVKMLVQPSVQVEQCLLIQAHVTLVTFAPVAVLNSGSVPRARGEGHDKLEFV